MKTIFVLLFFFVIIPINAQDDFNDLILDPVETKYDCHSELGENGFILYADIERPLKGVLAVGLTFDSIKNPESPMHILSVQLQWIRLKDAETDSLLLNQSLYINTLDGELLRCCRELQTKIKKSNCTVIYYNKSFTPLRVGYNFLFTILPYGKDNKPT